MAWNPTCLPCKGIEKNRCFSNFSNDEWRYVKTTTRIDGQCLLFLGLIIGNVHDITSRYENAVLFEIIRMFFRQTPVCFLFIPKDFLLCAICFSSFHGGSWSFLFSVFVFQCYFTKNGLRNVYFPKYTYLCTMNL